MEHFEYPLVEHVIGVHKTFTRDRCDNFVHGTYWECATAIMAVGNFSHSDNDSSMGDREFHDDKPGVYMTDRLKDVTEHYAWPCNVFGNNVFYGIFSRSQLIASF